MNYLDCVVHLQFREKFSQILKQCLMFKRITKNNLEFFLDTNIIENLFKYFSELFKRIQIHKHTYKANVTNNYTMCLVQNWC